MSRIIVNYCKEGKAYSDFEAEGFVENIIEEMKQDISSKEFTINVSTELLIDIFLCAVAEGKIPHSVIDFIFEGETYKVNEYGVIINCPTRFCSKGVNISTRKLVAQMKKRKNGN